MKADGTTSVLCRITIDGKSSTMATGIYCRPEDWNSRTGTVRTVRENNRLQEFRKSVGLAYDEILKKQLLCLPTLTAVNPPREKD